MDKMLREISKYPNGTPLIIEWPDGGSVLGRIDTIYETYNDLEFEDPSYKEFYACAFSGSNILQHSKKTEPFKIGDLCLFYLTVGQYYHTICAKILKGRIADI